ncbi:hypothetical protein [Streptomyces sp. NPDC050564]|uniref:hypothetical protein n=1 Tax=Streptomyces sp. NPDC050564 TaxID=3365631 RepID=UPI0037A2163F
MSEWRDAEEVALPVPDEVPEWRDIEFARTGLTLTLQRTGRRQKAQVLEYRDRPDGSRALLVIVDWPRPTIRMAWVAWDPDHMGLLYTERHVPATVEAEPQNGDAVIAGHDMLDCFHGQPVSYWPHHAVEVRVGGRWHEGGLRAHFNGPGGRSVAWVQPRFHEPEWRALVTFSRHYVWDPATIRPRSADQAEQA